MVPAALKKKNQTSWQNTTRSYMGLSLSIVSFLATHTQYISHKEHTQNYTELLPCLQQWFNNMPKPLCQIHAETRILPPWSLQTETTMPCSELQRKSQFKSTGVVRIRVILEMSLKKWARISPLIPNKWKVFMFPHKIL